MLARTGATLGDFDRLTHHLAHAASTGTAIPADAWRDDDALYLQFDLPGMDRSGISLTMERDTLVLTAERRSPIPDGAPRSSPSGPQDGSSGA
ncbi:Hsp20/alpha crystallin family protein [Streptomyces sp. NPDC001135]